MNHDTYCTLAYSSDIPLESPPESSVRYRNFISYSKGKGKKRRAPTEIELVGFWNRFYSWDRAPFDQMVGEVYGYRIPPGDTHRAVEQVEKLQRGVRRNGKVT